MPRLLRSLGRHPGYAAVAIVTLGLAIGSGTALFSVIHATLLEPLPYGNQDRIVIAFEKRAKEGTEHNGVTPADYLDWRAQSRSFSSLTAHDERPFNLTERGSAAPERVIGLLSTGGLLATYGISPTIGRGFAEADGGARVAMLSYGLWQRRFAGDRDVLGKTVALDREPYIVIGVMPADFRMYIGQPVDIFVPLFITPRRAHDRGGHDYLVVGRLRDGISLQAARSEMDAISARLARQYPVENTGHSANLVPIADFVTAKIRPALALVGAAVALLLLVACANVANLLLARAMARRRELAIRAALGAGRWHMIRLLTGESLALAAAAGLLGALLAYAALPLIALAAPNLLGTQLIPGIDRLSLDTSVLAFALALTFGAGLIAGAVPAILFTRIQLSLAERSPGAGAAGRRTRSALVVAELAISTLLLAAAALLGQSSLKIARVDPGFRTDHRLTLSLSLPATRYPEGRSQTDFFERLIEHAETLPSVRSAAVTTSVPGEQWGPRTGLRREGQPPARSIEDASKIYWRVVGGSFFSCMGIPIVRGRGFNAHDTASSTPVVLISQAAVRKNWPAGENPIGQRVELPFRKGWYTVAGITGDLHHIGPNKEVFPEIFLPLAQFPQSAMSLVVLSSGDPLSLARALKREIASLDPELPVSHVQTIEQLVANGDASRKFNSIFLGAFALLSLLLAAAGLYGAVAYQVTRRTQEIGIRMALGAQPSQVRRMILAEALKLAGAGVALGLLGAPLLGRLLRSTLFGVSTADPVTYAAIGAILFAVALIASFVPMRRATQIDPAQALSAQ